MGDIYKQFKDKTVGSFGGQNGENREFGGEHGNFGGSGMDSYGGGYGGGGNGGYSGGYGRGSITSALGSLNEQDYINKLYDKNVESEKNLIEQNYKDNTGILEGEKDKTQQLTDEYLTRTQIEALNNTMNTFNEKGLSLGAAQQAALTQENAKQNNLNRLLEQQNLLDEEFERQRQLLASEYEAAIKQAQLDNDMAMAQALYKAAQKEDQQMTEAKQAQANAIMEYASAVRNTESGEETYEKAMQYYGSMIGGSSGNIASGRTSADVLKYEDEIRKMYDSKYESAKLGLQTELDRAISELATKRADALRQTDEQLTDTYTDALMGAKNYAEVQNARGMGSGVFGQAQLAQDTELRDELTDIRTNHLDKDANYGVKNLDEYRNYSTNLQKKQAAINLEKAVEMLAAAETEEERKVAEAELQLQYQLMVAAYNATKDSGSSGGGGSGGGGSTTGSSGGKVTLTTAANAAAASGENMTNWLSNSGTAASLGVSNGYVVGTNGSQTGNLTDYLAVYT